MNLLNELKESLLKNKNRPAFCIKGVFYNYEQLQDRVHCISSYLRCWKEQHKTLSNVGVVTNNDLDTYASLLACWFSGVAYVPFNPSIPKGRNNVVVKEAQIKLVLSSDDLQNQIFDDNGETKITLTSSLNEAKHVAYQPKYDESSIAYILFTSGSTGTPKGVPIGQKNLECFVTNFLSTGYDVDPEDRCLQMFELTFDVSISSFLIPLLKGACIYTTPQGIKYVEVLKLIHTHKLTNVQIVPSIIKLGRSLVKRMSFPWLKRCILTGEATSVDLISDWQQCAPNVELYNFYGPTEATIYCSYYHFASTNYKSYNGLLGIGKPMGDTELLVVDDKGNETGVNEKGELMISSCQLTSGYLNNPEKNESSFIKIDSRSNHTFYRSGDLCYKDENGDIMYCGRLDNQIKIQGFRVELGEIEFLVQDKFKCNSVVVSIENKLSLTELILILESPRLDSEQERLVTDYLKTKLPDYMVPSKVINILEFPLNSNGKTDRKKLKDLLGVENK